MKADWGLTPDVALKVNPNSYFVDVDHEIIILNLASEAYFGLKTIGRQIWGLILEGQNLGEIHQQLLNEYQVDPQTLWRDLVTLVQDLLDQDLVAPVS